MIVADMLEMEQQFSVKILPEEAHKDEVVREFTPEAAEADLAETGKFNVRSSQMLRQEREKLRKRMLAMGVIDEDGQVLQKRAAP